MTFRLRSLVVALLLALAACSGAQSPGPAREYSARDYFPLRPNAAWSFDSVDMQRGGVPVLVTMRVTGSDGAGGFTMQQGSGTPSHYEYASGGVTRNAELFLSGPIRAGTRWRGQSGDQYTIQQTGLTRTVTAGTFHDVIEVVRVAPDATLVNGTEFRETFYYAPDVGPVEAIVPILVGRGDARRYRLTLRGYTLTGEF